jgi:DNA polymerase-3 subunit delta'
MSLPPWLAAQRDALLAQRGHAWLLHGPSGLGQFPLAMALARAWLCEAPQAGGACGRCAGCHAIDVHAHADLVLLMPEVEMLERGWPLPEKAQAEIDDKKRKPSREIRVDAMRDAVEFAQRTSARGRGKVVVVYPAEQMNAISANALLKTLEEPAGDTRFVLATEAAHALLPTIRSRCMAHALHWPPEDQALQWLAGQGVAPALASALLRAAGGRPDDALALAQAGASPAAWAAFPKAMQGGEVRAVEGWRPGDAIAALQKLCHDLLLARTGAAPRYFDAADLPQPPDLAALARWSKELAQAARTAEHPFIAPLMLEALVAQARNTLHLAPDAVPHTP